MNKEQTLLIATPHKFNFIPQYVASLVMLTHSLPSGMRFTVMLPECGLLHDIRNICFKEARDKNFDYLLFIDTDMDFPMDGLKKLVAVGSDVATGVYFQRQPPHRPVVYMKADQGFVKNLATIPTKPFEVDSCGAGFLLISKKVLQHPDMVNPFNYIPNDVGEWLSEDNSFCKRVRDAGFKIMAVPEIRLGHCATQIIYHDHYRSWQHSYLNQIEGWMGLDELEWLSSLAFENSPVVEVGSWKGRGTRALLSSGAKVIAVDHFKGSNDVTDQTYHEAKTQDIYAQFTENTKNYEKLTVMKMSSEEAAKQIEDKSVDAVFIDSTHTYEEVRDEIKRWLPKCRKKLAGHDYDWKGVKEAVDEAFGKKVQLVPDTTIWYVEV